MPKLEHKNIGAKLGKRSRLFILEGAAVCTLGALKKLLLGIVGEILFQNIDSRLDVVHLPDCLKILL